MDICNNLKPKQVFQYFETLAQIPHGSGNTKEISDYCVSFAKERGLSYYQDDYNNVIIFKGPTEGYETAEPVIIQGHMDMVCEKEADADIDFAKDGLELYVEGDFLKAKGTTLGGDDGIALAYALAILDSKDIPHPPIEAVFTVDEETGMLGANSIDVSMLKGRRLLNIDSDEEGVFLAGCAGGLRMDCEIPVSYTKKEGLCVSWKLTGLTGGHSGAEIHKERANAIVEAGRILKSLQDTVGISLAELKGGLMDNAIPREVTASVVIEPEQEEALKNALSSLEQTLQKEYHVSDPGLSVIVSSGEKGTYSVLDSGSFVKTLLFLRSIPYGVQHMSLDVCGLVETSLNPGILVLTKEAFNVHTSIRSSVTSRKIETADRLEFLTEFLGGTTLRSGDYPAWEYKADSPLRDLMAECYRDLFQEEPKIQAIHAGLECGLLSGKLPGLDCISFGPNNYDIHTPQERLSISSTERVWNLILEFLRRAK